MGIDFPRPLTSGAPQERVHAELCAVCPAMKQDRSPAPDIETASALVADGSLARVLRTLPRLPVLSLAA